MMATKMQAVMATVFVLLQMTLALSISGKITPANQTLVREEHSITNNTDISSELTPANKTQMGEESSTVINTGINSEIPPANETQMVEENSTAINTGISSELTPANQTQMVEESSTVVNTSINSEMTHANHTQISGERSSTMTCNNEVVSNLVEAANKSCSQITVVDRYIDHIQSREQVSIPSSADRHGFKDILNQYNGDLKVAQEHCNPWRQGDNVVASLENVVKTAQEFEPKLSDEHVKNKARIKDLLENHDDIAVMEAKIAALQRDIDEAKETAQLTNVTAVLTHLESVIENKEAEINATVKEYDLLQGRRELTELVKYLELVKTIAVKTEEEAVNASTKLEKFRENLINDAGAFKRHHNNAQDGMQKLEEERQNNNNELTSSRNAISDLRRKIAEDNSQIASLNAQIQQAHQDIRNIEASINRSIKKTRRRKKFGRWFKHVPVVNRVYKEAKAKEQRLKNEKRHFINEKTAQVQDLRRHITIRNQDIAHHEERIRNIEANSRELENELQYFSQLKGNLQDLENQVSGILPSIADAVNGVNDVKETFDSVKRDLDNTIVRAKEAKTGAEVQNMRFFVYNEIDDMRCEWETAKTKLESLEKCS